MDDQVPQPNEDDQEKSRTQKTGKTTNQEKNSQRFRLNRTEAINMI